MTRVIVFDLDDTLYLERDYVFSGFTAVGEWLHREHGIPGFGAAAWRRFLGGTRGTIFDEGFADLGIAPAPTLVAALRKVYRHHIPTIGLQSDAAAWLADPPPGTRLALLTDGPVASQSRKIAALGLAADCIWPQVISDTWGSRFRKPHPRGFRFIQRACDAVPANCVYVGDNAAKDFLAPRRLGWRTVQVVRPGAIHPGAAPTPAHAADAVITSLAGLETALDTLPPVPCTSP